MTNKSQPDPLIGRRAPDLTLPREDGTQYTLPVGQRVRITDQLAVFRLHLMKLGVVLVAGLEIELRRLVTSPVC